MSKFKSKVKEALTPTTPKVLTFLFTVSVLIYVVSKGFVS